MTRFVAKLLIDGAPVVAAQAGPRAPACEDREPGKQQQESGPS